jgi:hypothetical protein
MTERQRKCPRCSISIQSDVAWRRLALTLPAIWIAPKQQQLFRQRGLARVGVGNDGKRAAAT